MWMVAITALLLLPFFQYFIPGLPISLAVSDPQLTASSTSALKNILLLLESNSHSVRMVINGIVFGYLTISFLMVLYLAMGVTRIFWLSRHATPIQNPRIETILRRLQDANGITVPIRLLQNSHRASPLTWGIYKHRILLPVDFVSWDNTLIEQTLSHELAHIQRNDWLCFIISRIVICIYWLNPLTWYAHNKLVLESEKACDDAAVDDTGCSISYAENLLRLANSFNIHHTVAAPKLLGKKSTLSRRIHYILSTQNRRQQSDRSCLFSALLIAALLVAPFSALTFSLQISYQIQTRNISIPVNFIPKNSLEYRRIMLELGKA